MLGQLRRIVTPEMNAISTVFLGHLRAGGDFVLLPHPEEGLGWTTRLSTTGSKRMKIGSVGALAALAMLLSGTARAGRRRAQHLQLGQLHQPRADQEVRGEVQGQGHRHRLRLQRHGARQGQAGGHGFDIVVPSASYVPIWINEGLLLETRPDQMENFKNVDPLGRCDLDPGRQLHGAVAVGHDRRRR